VTKRILAGFDTKLRAALDSEVLIKNKHTGKLRISSFPFCPRSYLFNLVDAKSPTKTFSTLGRYYTEVGTITHEIIQDALERTDSKVRMVRDYECTSCHKKFVFRIRPKKCSCGSTEFKWHEHTVKYGKHIEGHIDDSTLLSTKRIWTIDYKTTSKEKIVQHRKTGKVFPYESNEAQLSAYSAIKWSEGYDIEGYALVYVARDNPSTYEIVPRLLKAPNKILRAIEGYDQQFDLIAQGRYEEIEPLCKTEAAINAKVFCSYRKLCLNAQEVAKHTEHIIKIVRKQNAKPRNDGR
jgi:hypothetical protein